jgi:hypothetical protein
MVKSKECRRPAERRFRGALILMGRPECAAGTARPRDERQMRKGGERLAHWPRPGYLLEVDS